MKTKNVPKGLKCKISDNFFSSNKGFPKGGVEGGPPLGKNSQMSESLTRKYVALGLNKVVF